jgi:hypothetical protein
VQVEAIKQLCILLSGIRAGSDVKDKIHTGMHALNPGKKLIAVNPLDVALAEQIAILVCAGKFVYDNEIQVPCIVEEMYKCTANKTCCSSYNNHGC